MGGESSACSPAWGISPTTRPPSFLARDYDGSAAYIVLGHLSEDQQRSRARLLSAEEAIRERGRLLGNRIMLAQQSAPIAPICL